MNGRGAQEGSGTESAGLENTAGVVLQQGSAGERDAGARRLLSCDGCWGGGRGVASKFCKL
jgi:hypothetical protein